MAEIEPESQLDGNAKQTLDDRRVEVDHNVELLSARDPRTRSQAAKRLGELHAGAESLLAALKDPNPYVRSAAADALGFSTASNPGEVIDHLLDAIDDPNDYVCASAIHSLGILHTDMAAPQIEDCLDDPNPLVIQAAILALGRMGAVHLNERLASFLDHPHYLVRLSSARAVALLGYTAAGESLITNLEELIRQRDGTDFKLPKAYIEALARLRIMEAVPLLIRIAQDEIGLRSVAVEALINLRAREAAPMLVSLFNDPSDRLRRDLVELMVSVDYRVALPQIRQLLRDHSVSTRSAALTAVQSWHDLESVETIRWMAFADVNPFIRPQALDCLVAFLGAEAVPDLQKLEKDVNPQVRQQAALHLEKFPNQANETLAEDKVPKVFLWPENWYSPWTESDGPYREESGKLRVVDLARILWHWKTNLVCQPWPVSPDLLARLDQALSEVINLVEEAQEEIQATGSSGSGFVTDHP